jgi:hypothetical protein
MFRNVFHDHHSVSILDVFLQFLECPALRHYFRVLDELAEPEFFGSLIEHCLLRIHSCMSFQQIANAPQLKRLKQEVLFERSTLNRTKMLCKTFGRSKTRRIQGILVAAEYPSEKRIACVFASLR